MSNTALISLEVYLTYIYKGVTINMYIAINDALQHSMEFDKVEKTLEIRLEML